MVVRKAVIAALLFAAATGYAIHTNPTQLQALSGKISGKVYPFSIVPGGVYSQHHLVSETGKDPVISAHYADFDSQHVSFEKSWGMNVYVSYRVGDRVYWTKRRVEVPEGELVLIDGENIARARCGNRISFIPQEPTMDVEPVYISDEELPEPINDTIQPEDPITFQTAGLSPLTYADEQMQAVNRLADNASLAAYTLSLPGIGSESADPFGGAAFFVPGTVFYAPFALIAAPVAVSPEPVTVVLITLAFLFGLAFKFSCL